MDIPLGDEPSKWLTGDVRADALLYAIRAIDIGDRNEVSAVRAIYIDLHRSPSLNVRCLLVLDAGFCITTPGYALQMHRRAFAQNARKLIGYSPEDEAYVRKILIEKLAVLADGRTASLGRLVNDYFSLLSWEKEQVEQKKLQIA